MTVMVPLFFGIPQSVVRNGRIKRLSGTAVKLYIALWHESEYTCTRELTRTAKQLVELVGGHRNSIAAAQKELVKAGLVIAEPFGAMGFVYQLCNPETDKPWPGPPDVKIPYVKKNSEPTDVPEAVRLGKRRKANNSALAGTNFPFGANVSRQGFEGCSKAPRLTGAPRWDEIGS